MNVELKSILDRWGACMLTLEDAEKELREVLLPTNEAGVGGHSIAMECRAAAEVTSLAFTNSAVSVNEQSNKTSGWDWAINQAIMGKEPSRGKCSSYLGRSDDVTSRVLVFQHPHKLSGPASDRLREQIKAAFGDGIRAVVLEDGMTLANQHGLQPSAILAKVGNLELRTFGGVFWEATIDEKPLPRHRHLEIILEAGEPPVVKLECLMA